MVFGLGEGWVSSCSNNKTDPYIYFLKYRKTIPSTYAGDWHVADLKTSDKSVENILNWVSRVVQDCFGFALPCYGIGSETRAIFLTKQIRS